MKTNRRSVFKMLAAGVTGLFGFAAASAATKDNSDQSYTGTIIMDQGTPLFSSARVYNGLVYIAGKGCTKKAILHSTQKLCWMTCRKNWKKRGLLRSTWSKPNVIFKESMNGVR